MIIDVEFYPPWKADHFPRVFPMGCLQPASSLAMSRSNQATCSSTRGGKERPASSLRSSPGMAMGADYLGSIGRKKTVFTTLLQLQLLLMLMMMMMLMLMMMMMLMMIKEDAILSKAKPCFSLKIGFLSKYLGILRGPCQKTLRIPNLFVHATFQAAKFCHKVCTNAWVVPVWRSESPLAESTAVGPWEYGNHIVFTTWKFSLPLLVWIRIPPAIGGGMWWVSLSEQVPACEDAVTTWASIK